MFKCAKALPPGMLALGATDVTISMALTDDTAAALALEVAACATLVRLTVAGTVPPDGVARIAAAALTVRGLTFVQLAGARACVMDALLAGLRGLCAVGRGFVWQMPRACKTSYGCL